MVFGEGSVQELGNDHVARCGPDRQESRVLVPPLVRVDEHIRVPIEQVLSTDRKKKEQLKTSF